MEILKRIGIIFSLFVGALMTISIPGTIITFFMNQNDNILKLLTRGTFWFIVAVVLAIAGIFIGLKFYDKGLLTLAVCFILIGIILILSEIWEPVRDILSDILWRFDLQVKRVILGCASIIAGILVMIIDYRRLSRT